MPPREAFEEVGKPNTGKPLPLKEAAGLSETSFEVPISVYGTSMLVGILYEYGSLYEWFSMAGEAYIRLLLNYNIQLALLVAVYQLEQWQEDTIEKDIDCFQITGFFFAVSHWVFFAAMITEMTETLEMAELVLRQVPTLQGPSECLKFVAGEDGVALASGGMSMARKICICVGVVLPKFVIGVLLLIVGGKFLSSSGSNTDLLLNSLAVNFVTDVDEMIFGFLTPKPLRRLVESIPPFESDVATPLWKLLHGCSTSVNFALSGLLVLIFYLDAPKCTNDPCDGAIRSCPVFGI